MTARSEELHVFSKKSKKKHEAKRNMRRIRMFYGGDDDGSMGADCATSSVTHNFVFDV